MTQCNTLKMIFQLFVSGQVRSMGSFLLMAGTKGKRYSLPNSRIMIHQPSGGAQGQASDIEIQAQEILRLKKMLNKAYETHTGKAFLKLKKLWIEIILCRLRKLTLA